MLLTLTMKKNKRQRNTNFTTLVTLLLAFSSPFSRPTYAQSALPGESRQWEYLPGATRTEIINRQHGNVVIVETDRSKLVRFTLPDGRIREYSITKDEPAFNITTHPGVGTNKYALESIELRLNGNEFDRYFHGMSHEQRRLSSVADYAEKAKERLSRAVPREISGVVTLEQRRRLLGEVEKDIAYLGRVQQRLYPVSSTGQALPEILIPSKQGVVMTEERFLPRAYAAARVQQSRTLSAVPSESVLLGRAGSASPYAAGIAILRGSAAVAGLFIVTDYVVPALTGGEAPPDPSKFPIFGPVAGPLLDAAGKTAAGAVVGGLDVAGKILDGINDALGRK